MKRSAPAVARNREPILRVLETLLPGRGTVLEIASGTGEHSVFFAAHLPELTFLPSDVDEDQLASIEAWRRDAGLSNVLPARRIDVLEDTAWHDEPLTGVFCANMLHIAPLEAMDGLVRGAARHLAIGGLLVTYGPYKMGGVHTAPSNESFDEWLKDQDPRYGVRDLERLVATAHAHGLEHRETIPMPANNFVVVFVKGSPVSAPSQP